MAFHLCHSLSRFTLPFMSHGSWLLALVFQFDHIKACVCVLDSSANHLEKSEG